MGCVEDNLGQEQTPVVHDNNSTSKGLRLP